MYARLHHLDRAHARENLPRRQMTVADDLPVAMLIGDVRVGVDVAGDLGLDGLGEHPLRAFTQNLRHHVSGRWKSQRRVVTVNHRWRPLARVGPFGSA